MLRARNDDGEDSKEAAHLLSLLKIIRKYEQLKQDLLSTKSELKKTKITKRLKLVESFISSKNISPSGKGTQRISVF